MKKFLWVLLASSSALAGHEVGNGGGLSEQAVLLAMDQLPRTLKQCQVSHVCQKNREDQFHLQKLLSCSFPKISQMKFLTAEQNDLIRDRDYLVTEDGSFLINREHLYSTENQPMNISQATQHSFRMMTHYCQIEKGSEALANQLGQWVHSEGERVVVGKDNLYLATEKWIRVRTYSASMLIEASSSLVQVQCSQKYSLEQCSAVESFSLEQASEFFNLSLVQESLHNGELHFSLDGSATFEHGIQNFRLNAVYQDGLPRDIYWNGRPLKLPQF